MVVSGFASALCRRALSTLVLAAVVGGGSVAWAQDAAAKDDFKFTADAAVVLWVIAPDGVAPFDSAWTAIRAKLAASEKPEYREVASSLRIFKSTAASAEGQTYFFVIDPTSKTTSYNITFLLYEAGLFTREEADSYFTKIQPAIGGLNVIAAAKLP
jgi:hypothetical protein